MSHSSAPDEPDHAQASATAEYPRGLLPVPEFDPNKLAASLEAPPEPTAQADRRNARGKMAAGIRGLK